MTDKDAIIQSNYVKISRIIDDQKALKEEIDKLHQDKKTLEIQLKGARINGPRKKIKGYSRKNLQIIKY